MNRSQSGRRPRLDAFVANVMITQVELANLRGIDSMGVFLFFNINMDGFSMVFIMIHLESVGFCGEFCHGFCHQVDHVLLLHISCFIKYEALNIKPGITSIALQTGPGSHQLCFHRFSSRFQGSIGSMSTKETKTDECLPPATVFCPCFFPEGNQSTKNRCKNGTHDRHDCAIGRPHPQYGHACCFCLGVC